MIQAFLNKYKNMGQPVKMAFWFLMCSFLQKGISMMTTPIFTRIMTDTEFGRYSIYNSWSTIISVFATLSVFGNCHIRGLVAGDNSLGQQKYTASLQGLLTTCVALVFGIYFIFRDTVNRFTGLNTYLFALMFIDMLFVSTYQFWLNEKRVRYDCKGLVAITVSYSVLRPVVAIIAVMSASQSTQVEARISAVLAVNIFLFSGIYFSIFIKGKIFFEKESWKYALTFCIPLIPHYLSKIILNESDRIMIGRFCGSAPAAHYTIAYTIAGIMTIFISAVAKSLDPWIYQSIKDKNLSQIGSVSYRIAFVIAAMNALVMVIAPEVLQIMAPPSYAESLAVIPPVTASVFFIFLDDLFASFQLYFKKTRWIAIASFGGAALNIVLNAIFIPRFGYAAAGYTTLFSYAVFGVLHFFFMRKVCKMYMDGYKVYDWKIIFGIGGVMILLSGTMLFLYDYVLPRYLILAVMLVCLFVFRKRIIMLFNAIQKKSKDDEIR